MKCDRSKQESYFLSLLFYLFLQIEFTFTQYQDNLSFESYASGVIKSWKLLQEQGNSLERTVYDDYHDTHQPKVDIASKRSFVPDLGSLVDLLFLLAPRDFPASGVARLSRDIFESEQCVEYVGCEVTSMSYKHKSLNWVMDFLQDFPFQGDLADKLRYGSVDAVTRLKNDKRKQEQKQESVNAIKTEPQVPICSFSCHPIRSLSRGLKILSLLHDLIRTVR